MKIKLLLLLLVLVALVVTFAACDGESAATSAEAETTIPATIATPAVTTTPPATATELVVSTQVPATTDKVPFETNGGVPISTLPATTGKTPLTESPLVGMNAQEAYEYAYKKMGTLEGFDSIMTQDVILDEEVSHTEMIVKVNLADGKKGYMSTKTDEGSTVEMTLVDGIAYCVVKATGMEVKYKTQDEAITGTFEEVFTTFKEEDDLTSKIASAKILSCVNGIYTVELVATKEAAIETIMADYADLEVDPSIFSDISMIKCYEITEEGYIISALEELNYSVNGMYYQETLTCRFNNIGTVPEITVPADADSYMNMDEMQ